MLNAVLPDSVTLVSERFSRAMMAAPLVGTLPLASVRSCIATSMAVFGSSLLTRKMRVLALPSRVNRPWPGPVMVIGEPTGS